MSEVTIRWTQRAAGREIGDEETVERTAFIDAVIAAGRVDVLSESAPTPVEAENRTRRVRVNPETTNEAPDGATEAV